MNEERTYGVEMELHLTSGSIAGVAADRYASTSSQHRQLAQVINLAFQAEGINHYASSSGWGQQTDGHNYHEWVIKTDGSLSPSPFDGHPHSTEIVSPVLKGKAGLRALEIVCRAIEPYVKVSKKCGLHVHHGLRAEEIKPLIRRWLKIERVVLESLPKSRRDGNRYCRPLGQDLGGWGVREPRDSEDLRAWHTANCRDGWGSGGSRYTTLNIASFWLRGTVEFRCAAGTYEYDKISNWVIFTQSLLEKQDVPVDQLGTVEDLVAWIHEEEPRRTVQETVERTVEVDPLEQVMSQRVDPAPISDPFSWYPGTRFLHCRRGTMAADIDQLLLDGCWLSDAIHRIAGAHDRNIAQARNKILTHINFLRGQGVTVEQQGRRGRDVHYQVVPRDRADSLSINLPPARPRRERVTVERVIPAGTVHADADFLAAVLWLKQRWLQFNRPRVQQAVGEEFTLF